MSLHRYLIMWSAVFGCLASCLATTPLYCVAGNTNTSSPSDAKRSPIVDAPAGKVEGLIEGRARFFKGIPYVLPPIGPARWRPPSPMPRWKGVRKAVDFGAACWQPKPTLSNIYTRDPMPMSEDCLTLNIWTPSTRATRQSFFGSTAER